MEKQTKKINSDTPTYRKLTAKDIAKIKTIVAAERVFYGTEISGRLQPR